MILEYDVFETRMGWVGFLTREGQVCRLVLPNPERDLTFQELCQSRQHSITPHLTHPLRKQLIDYFCGERIDNWAVVLDWTGVPAFTRSVLQEAQNIPWGTVVTYGDLAAGLGRPGAARAVGQALGRNPFPLIVPCHRVVAAGGPGGFSAAGGLETKKALLELEGVKLTLGVGKGKAHPGSVAP